MPGKSALCALASAVAEPTIKIGQPERGSDLRVQGSASDGHAEGKSAGGESRRPELGEPDRHAGASVSWVSFGAWVKLGRGGGFLFGLRRGSLVEFLRPCRGACFLCASSGG